MVVGAGKKIRFYRFFDPKDDKAVCVAADHGWMSDPTPNVINLKRILKDVIDGGADGVLMSLGQSYRLYHLFEGPDKPALLLRLDWMNILRLGSHNVENAVPVSTLKRAATATAKDALLMGASAVTVYYFVGYTDELEAQNLESLGILAQECRKQGLPLIIEPMPFGGRVYETDFVRVLKAAARTAMEIGADAIKIEYTGDVESFKELVDLAKVPVLMLGGPRSKKPKDAFDMVYEGMKAGASGVVFGRNVTASDNPKRMVEVLVKMVHHGIDPEEALKFFEMGDQIEIKQRVKLQVNSENCTNCGLCEIACANYHEGIYDKKYSRLYIEAKEFNYTPRVCIDCGICEKVCPEGAIRLNRQVGGVVIDSEKCTLCGICVSKCPTGVLKIVDNRLLGCDRCGGDPECVKWCNFSAITKVVMESQLPTARRSGGL